MAPGGKDPPKGAMQLDAVEEKPPQQKPNGTALARVRGLLKNNSSADRRLTDRQLVIGIQIGDVSVYML
jgi:hypothetical protein